MMLASNYAPEANITLNDKEGNEFHKQGTFFGLGIHYLHPSLLLNRSSKLQRRSSTIANDPDRCRAFRLVLCFSTLASSSTTSLTLTNLKCLSISAAILLYALDPSFMP
jgi:hypothetical protein